MLARLSRCFRCGSTAIECRPVEELVRWGRCVAVLRVPANVCSECGEQYFEKRQVEMFEDVRRRLERGISRGFGSRARSLSP